MTGAQHFINQKVPNGCQSRALLNEKLRFRQFSENSTARPSARSSGATAGPRARRRWVSTKTAGGASHGWFGLSLPLLNQWLGGRGFWLGYQTMVLYTPKSEFSSKKNCEFCGHPLGSEEEQKKGYHYLAYACICAKNKVEIPKRTFYFTPPRKTGKKGWTNNTVFGSAYSIAP